MALVVKDRVKVTTATTGTGTLTLGSAVAGFQAFSAVLSNADTTYYAIFESSTGAFEVGLGTYASPANTLARTTVLQSSSAGSAINLTAGDADVFVTQPAEKAVYLDADGHIFVSDGRNLTNLNATNLTTGTVNDARLPATISSDITGNAATATAWATGRTLALTGDVTGTSAAFDGSGNITLSTTIAANSVALGTDTTGNYVATGAVSGSGLSGSASAESATFTVTSNATNANTPSTIVFRDGSGNFSAGTITAALNGNATNISAYTINQNLGTGDSPTFSAPRASNRLSVGSTAPRINSVNTIELSGGSSSFLMSVQDGSGRVQMRWNATTGVTPTYLVSGEQSARYEILDVTQPADALWRIDHADAGTAGAVISYTNILSLGTTTFTYNGNTVWNAGNDGAGSGLDADTLDGQHASSFASTGKAIAMAIVFG